MKKILAMILAAMMLFAVVSCKKDDADKDDTNSLNGAGQDEFYTDANTGDKFGYVVNDKGAYEIVSFSSNNNTPHKVEIPAEINGVEVNGIGAHAFKVNNQMNEVVIPDSILYIGDWAFFGCSYLTSVTLPNSVEEIGIGAFDSCTVLKTVKLSDKLTKITEFAFRGCGALEEVTIPSSVKEIEDGAFFKCAALKEIVIPDSVTTIGDGAFMHCVKLEKATVASSVENFGRRVFDVAAESFTIVAGEGTKAAQYAADNGYSFTKAA